MLELGSGTCANLSMIAQEGFQVCGLDFCRKAIRLGHKVMLARVGKSKNWRLSLGSMTLIPFEDSIFDVVLDVFSSYCLPEKEFSQCLQEIKRVLKPGGRLFFYTPGKNSSSWRRFAPARKIDRSTLNGIYREEAPFAGNHYPFRFVSPVELRRHLKKAGFLVEYLGTVRRSYPGVREWFTHVVAYASKVAP